MEYETFISYAEENNALATEIAGAIKSHGFNIWYSPLSLKIGEKLLNSIEEGINKSKSGILIISPEYLSKNWTSFEMDTFLHQSVEQNKKIFPLWHNVIKEDVIKKHSSLGNVVSLNTDIPFPELIKKLVDALSQYAPTICVTPSYQKPKFQFLSGRGEMTIGSENGPATSLWELIIHLKEDQYPIYCDGELLTREDILFHASQSISHIPEIVKNFVLENGYEKVWEICKNAGFDPKIFE